MEFYSLDAFGAERQEGLVTSKNATIISFLDENASDLAEKVLDDGGLVVFGTESSYGIAARIDRPKALGRLSSLKCRPSHSPFALIAANQGRVREFCEFPEPLDSLAKEWWPGALTLALQPKLELHEALLSESNTVGIRVSPSRSACVVSSKGGGVVTATSANLRGAPAAHSVDALSAELLSEVDLVLDSGPCLGGEPSSVVGWVDGGLRVYREGAIPISEMETFLGKRER